MAALEEHQQRYVARVARSQKKLLVAGALIACTGALYLTWGIVHFNPHVDPRVNPGFDRPVAELAFLFERGQTLMEKSVASTPTEARLMYGLSRNMQFSAGVMVMLLRIFIGTLVMVSGFAIMTVVVERTRLLRLISRLRE